MNREKISATQKILMEIRPATVADIPQIADIFRAAREGEMPYLPKLHTGEEDREYFTRLPATGPVEIAVRKNAVVGFCAFKTGWLDHLYVHPDHQGKSIGTSLLNRAKGANAQLQLWVFQKNKRAGKFYEKRGFILEKMTDGNANEEKEPDALYRWTKKDKQATSQ